MPAAAPVGVRAVLPRVVVHADVQAEFLILRVARHGAQDDGEARGRLVGELQQLAALLVVGQGPQDGEAAPASAELVEGLVERQFRLVDVTERAGVDLAQLPGEVAALARELRHLVRTSEAVLASTSSSSAR